MEMELELFSNVVSEDTVEVDADNDNFGVEGERCGICMDIIIDRGVLDCCQHWFCFVCIDNWATITNLCPLCQNEFQLITCVPVFDTIGSSKMDEDSDNRDDDWCVEGNNNTLSFPSYYIDENAVTCLDGDGCKIRSGLVTYEDNSMIDTSIACDSCDIWYHAFCVGFDTEGTAVDSWLCPRCLGNEEPQKSGFKEIYSIENQINLKNANRHSLVDTVSGKVSVSVADAGETAVVVSRIDGKHVTEESTENGISTLGVTNHGIIQQSLLGPESCPVKFRKRLDHEIDDIPPEPPVPSAKLHEIVVKTEPFDSESELSLDLGLSSGSKISEDDKTKILLGGVECLHDASNSKLATVENSADLKAKIIGEKRKRAEYSIRENGEDGPGVVRVGSGSSKRKVKAQRGIQKPSHSRPSDDQQKTNIQRGRSSDEIGGNIPVKKRPSIDIMSIVRGSEPRSVNRSVRQKEVDKCEKVQTKAARLRVKKIMRRPSDDKESADVVQKLRKEIREAVRKKSSDDIGKRVFDPNLLAAFRAAVAGSAATPVQKPSAATVKAKKLLLQKGKTRENLTKKIYSTSNGKRRRAWDRDCEVEFWKHRCVTTSKPEKIETLMSVLNLLRKSPETKNLVQNTEEEEDKAPILSRLYLADASVFPRKDDIKPLSVLKAEKDIKPNEIPTQSNTSSADDEKKKSGCIPIKNGATSAQLPSNRRSDKSSPEKKMSGKSDDIKVDKRKWALEVLARKTASNNTSSMHQKQDDAVFKGNYPLLAELPTDMRPNLAPIRHNKIPNSVRQAQLYRLTEHFLKIANLSSIHRSAATELAVADATNIEKQVAERSNSKTVYLNLCSQEIRRHTNSCISEPEPEPEPTPSSSPLLVPTQEDQSSITPFDSEAEEALRNAGLLSDSPPSSPGPETVDLNKDGNYSTEVEERETEDIFEMGSHPDVDIYGDFEYDLDEEDYIGASAIKASKSLPEEVESKVKVVFSTLSSNKTENAPMAEDQDLPKNTDIQLSSSSSLVGCPNDADNGNSAMDDDKKVDYDYGEGEELSVVECEELYGPEKEPLITKFPELVSVDNLGPQSTNNVEVKSSDKKDLVPDSSQAVENSKEENRSDPKADRRSENGESVLQKDLVLDSSQAVENSQENRSDPKVDKRSEHGESVLKKVEAYIKEHIRPLCKSGVITVEQYRWAVGKTTDKVMKYHPKSKNANFLIKEGEKVKKLAEQYVEAAKHKENK